MTSNEARELFKDKGLSYNDITVDKIDILIEYVQRELELEHNYNSTSLQMLYSEDSEWLFKSDGTLAQGYIKVNSIINWENREAISFNRDGFIGFAGWASSTNVKPFLNAFVKWVDDITMLKTFWSKEDNSYITISKDYPSLSTFGDTKEESEREFRTLLSEVNKETRL